MFELNYPNRILFAWQARTQISAVVKRITGQSNSSYLLVTGAAPHYQVSTTDIAACLGEPCAAFTNVRSEPTLDHVSQLATLLDDTRPDTVIAVGGGSIIDAAKAAAIVAGQSTRDVADFFHNRRAIERPGIPLIAVPTTAGTGAEVTRNAVLTDTQTRIKKSIRHPFMVPAAAVIDPELTLSLPPSVTAATGLDALTQAIESYISRRAHAVSRPLAMAAVERIWANLHRACHDGRCRHARTAMAEGSLLSAMAFSQSGLGAVHGLAHPLGTLLDLPHGFICGVLLPHVLRFNDSAARARYADLGRAVGRESGPAFLDGIDTLCDALDIPTTLSSPLSSADVEFILANCRSNSMTANPRALDDCDVLYLLNELGLTLPKSSSSSTH